MKYKKAAWLILALVTLISVIFGIFVTHLKFNYDFESFFPYKDPDLNFYKTYRQKFDADDNFFLIGLDRKAGIFHEPFLEKAAALSDSLRKLEAVTHVISPVKYKEIVIGPMGLMQIPLIHVHEPRKYHSDSVRIRQSGGFVKNLISNDGQSLMLIVNHQRLTKKPQQLELLNKVKYQLKQSGLHDYHLSGKIEVQDAFVKKMKDELIIFVSISFVLVVIFLWLAFRSLWGIVVPLIVVMLSIVWTLGLMGFTGQSLNIMTVLLPSILFVVGMSDVVHIVTRFIDEAKNGKNKIESIRAALKEVALATLLTSLTTAVGFLTLLTASIRPLQYFGLYTSAGVLIAFILACSLLPASLIMLPRKKLPLYAVKQAFWRPYLWLLYRWIITHKNMILIIFLFIIVLAVGGLMQVRVNSTILEDLPADDPVKRDYLYFEEKFEGVRPFEMAVWVKDSSRSVFDYEIIQSLNQVQQYLADEYHVAGIISPVTFVKQLNKAKNGGVHEAYQIPDDKQAYLQLQKYLKKMKKRDAFKQIVVNEGKEARFSGRMEDLGSARVSEKNDSLRHFIISRLDTAEIGYRLTGTALLIDKNNKLLAGDMTRGLSIGFAVIGLLMGLLYRSWRMVGFSLLINMIPLVMIAGVIGWFGIGLKATTSIIFTIAFGIAVDDTIHFLSKYKLELQKGTSSMYALKKTFFATGKALVVTSLILVAGFLTLILSDFNGTHVTGLMVSLTLVFALLADLFLLPVLIILFYKPARKTF